MNCRGDSQFGQTGQGFGATSSASGREGLVTGLTDARQLSVGWSYACAIRNDGSLWCWGRNDVGQLGDGTFEDRAGPVQVEGLPRVTQVATSAGGTCALGEEGELFCWGWRGWPSRSFDGSMVDRTGALTRPSRVLWIPPVVHVATALQRSCAALRDGSVVCWAELSNSSAHAPSPEEPEPLSGFAGAVEVSVGTAMICARTAEGVVTCASLGAPLLADDASSCVRRGRRADQLGYREIERGVEQLVVQEFGTTCVRFRHGGVSCGYFDYGLRTAHEIVMRDVPIAFGELPVRIDAGRSMEPCAIYASGAVSCEPAEH